MTIEINIEVLLIIIKNTPQGSDSYEQACSELNMKMPGVVKETLKQLVDNGPIWDGDIISKSARDTLLTWGIASRACFKGEQGYTVANYTGYDVLLPRLH